MGVSPCGDGSFLSDLQEKFEIKKVFSHEETGVELTFKTRSSDWHQQDKGHDLPESIRSREERFQPGGESIGLNVLKDFIVTYGNPGRKARAF